MLEEVNNIQLLCLSSLFGAIVLLIMNIMTGKMRILKEFCAKDYFIIALIGLPGIFLYHIFYYAGAERLLAGTALCLLAAISYGLFTALNQKKNYDKCISMMINFFVAFILTGVIIVVKGDWFVPTSVQCLGIVWSGVFTMAIPNTMWILALERGNAARISNLAYITPFLSLLWTSLILKEDLNVYSIIGLLVIIAGILIQLKDKTGTRIQN